MKPLDPMVVAAVMFSADKEVARHAQVVARPTSDDPRALFQYWVAATKIAGEDLSLAVVNDLPMGAFGLTSVSLMSQATLADVLDQLGSGVLGRIVPGMHLRVLPIPFDAVDIRLSSDAETEGDAEIMALLEEMVVAVVHNHLALLTTPATIQAVTLRRAAPRDPAPWKKFFNVTPRFGQRYTTMRLNATALQAGLRTSNPELRTLVGAAAHTADDATIADRVRTYIRRHLREDVDAETMASALELTTRTLQRRLHDEETTLRELATAVRVEVAQEMLEHGDASIAEVADSVGFAHSASFTRAFVAATGEAPQAFRKRIRGDS